MSQTAESVPGKFTNRRTYDHDRFTPPGVERRQFSNSHAELSPAARDLAHAIDTYKLRHRRRFITYEEMLVVIESLGYRKHDAA